ncbi:acyltransferase family protein [Mucilaginibacter flavus]|uniref:acyltransferase family protein n=1 Tax=Mucilaginibacter flavus TaxID=931504 RepID=UPI0025B5B36A|nr:acyltransferase [Mucilaginibacter flavus]MDN3582331.1 acyltransferase [Mucilaginibacter flavus]
MNNLQQLDSGRNNNFDLIRFIAASMVIFSHSYWLTGNLSIEPLGKLCGIVNFGSLGVKVFFAISGFLITKSVMRQPTLTGFVWARVLRIFPGLLMASVFCTFVIGPICTVLPLRQYLNNGALYSFVWRLTILHNYPNTLPGVFISNPIPNNVNSPVWTLPGELMMYIGVLFLGAVLLMVKKGVKTLITIVPLAIAVLAFVWGVDWLQGNNVYIVSWTILFFLGMTCYFLRSKIVLSVPVFVGMAIAFLLLFHFRFKFIEIAFDVVLMYCILTFAYHPKFQIKNFHKIGDLSYGLYIYAMPIQQLVVQKFALLNPFSNFFVSYAMVLPVAALSWHFMEKPILKLKTITLFKAD